MSNTVAERLIRAGVIDVRIQSNGDRYLQILRNELCFPEQSGIRARNLVESAILDSMRDWARNMGLASYEKITIRGDSSRVPIGPFLFDLAGPSYLLPLKSTSIQPGFLVADVFTDMMLDEFHIKYFIRKSSMLQLLLKNAGVLPILVADSFTGAALRLGHAAGIVMATPKNLYGQRVASALTNLLETITRAGAYASSSPERLTALIEDLSEIEGAAGNLRGILFELIVAYLVRRDAVSIDVGRVARDPETGKTAEIDILKITSQSSNCVAIECKGKNPGGSLALEDAQEWIRRLPIFQRYLRSQPSLREAALSFELWTSGSINDDALTYLAAEKKKRKAYPIDWKNGLDVINLAQLGKEKSIADALNEHFFKHVLSGV